MMTKPLQKWKLPQPTDIKEDNEWIAFPRISRTIPFGYELDKDDPDILQPVENELDMLEEAKKYLRIDLLNQGYDFQSYFYLELKQ